MERNDEEQADKALEMSDNIGKVLAAAIGGLGYQKEEYLPISLCLALGKITACHLAYNGKGLKHEGLKCLFEAFKEGFTQAESRANEVLKEFMEKEDAKAGNKDSLH